MNRPRKSKGPYPPCFYSKHGAFYLVRNNKWTRLGADLSLALAEYGRLMEGEKLGGMPKAIEDHYEALPDSLAKTTKEQYRYAADVLKRKLKQFEPREVKGKHVAAIMESLSATPNMANRVLSFLRQVFHGLVKRAVVDDNPCNGIPRFKEQKRTRLISLDEWDAIHAKADPRLQVIMELQYLTGQRISDVLKIRRSQLTADGIEFDQQKTGNRLTVKWTPELVAAVERAKALSADRPAVTLLRGRFGGAPDYRSIHEQWRIACKAAKVEDARLNDGRAMSATAAKRQGKNAQALLGHTTEANTIRYTRDRERVQAEGPSFRRALDAGQKSD